MRDGLKWGLILGGAFLAYKSGALDSLMPVLGLPPGGTATAPTGGGGSTATPDGGKLVTTPTTTGGGGSTAAPAPAVIPFTDAELRAKSIAAAAGDAVIAAVLTGLGVRYNGHQWNYFREQAGNAPAPATENLEALMTATEYLAYRSAHGLGGLVSLGGLAIGYFGGRRA